MVDAFDPVKNYYIVVNDVLRTAHEYTKKSLTYVERLAPDIDVGEVKRTECIESMSASVSALELYIKAVSELIGARQHGLN